MSDIFAKLFDTPDGQLLAFLDETDDSEPAVTVIGARVEGVRPKVKMSGWPDGEAGQRLAFDKIDQALANKSAADLRAVAAGMAKP